MTDLNEADVDTKYKGVGGGLPVPKSDVRDMRLCSPKKISNFLLYSYISFALLDVFGSLSYLMGLHSTVLLYLSYFLSAIFFSVLLYKIWAIIQIGSVRATPARAVGYLFIPYFQFYWTFRAFWGWTKSYNEVLSEADLKESRMSELLGGAASLILFALYASFFLMISIGSGIEEGIDRNVLIRCVIYLLLLQGYALVVSIIFFWKASDCANFLANKLNSGDIAPSPNRKLEVDCPECGRPLKGAIAQMIGEISVCQNCKAEFEITEGSTPVMAVAALPLSFYPILNIVGFVFGFISFVRIKKSKARLCGHRVALASTIIASITIVLSIAWISVAVLTRQKQLRLLLTNVNLKYLHSAVNQFEMETGRFPTEDEGLLALIKQPSDVEVWEPGGYLESTVIPTDSWGNDFIYELFPESGIRFVIRSCGPDGEVGTEDDLLSIEPQ